MFVCDDMDNCDIKTTRQCLRLCCTTLCRANDASKTCIHLRPDQLTSRAGYVRKLKNLTNARIRISIHEDPVLNDLRPLTTTAPDLSSFTLVTGCEVVMLVRDLDHMLQPWRNTLLHLVVEHCDLTVSVGEDGAAEAVQTWNPEFPLLKTLTVKAANIAGLDMSGCPVLQALCLEDNRLLTSLNLHACVSLQTLLCQDSLISELDISACQALTSVSVRGNSKLGRLDVCDLKHVKFCDCHNNVSLSALDLHGCECLETVYCPKNPSMAVLQLEGCSMLRTLYIRTGGLTALDVSSCISLAELDCSNNASLAALDISRCVALKSLHKYDCSLLNGMDTSSHPNLKLDW